MKKKPRTGAEIMYPIYLGNDDFPLGSLG